MTKTIEELVYSFAIRQFHKTPINTERDLMCTCSDFANEFLAQPLSKRLTAEEKERVRKVYRRNCAEIAKHDNDVITAHSEGVMHALELFFGTDFFKEEE